MRRAFPWLFALGVAVHLAMHALPPSWAGGFGVGSGGLQGTSGGGSMSANAIVALLVGKTITANNYVATGTGLDLASNGRVTWGGGNYLYQAADGAVYSTAGWGLGVRPLISNTAPSITGFGTSPSVVTANGTGAFTINVGTGGSASTGTIILPTATTGWVCTCFDVTTPASFVTNMTGGSATTCTVTNYSRTTGLAIAWTASDVLRCMAMAY